MVQRSSSFIASSGAVIASTCARAQAAGTLDLAQRRQRGHGDAETLPAARRSSSVGSQRSIHTLPLVSAASAMVFCMMVLRCCDPVSAVSALHGRMALQWRQDFALRIVILPQPRIFPGRKDVFADHVSYPLGSNRAPMPARGVDGMRGVPVALSDHLLGRGRGLNSIPVRFALMALASGALALWVAHVWLSGRWARRAGRDCGGAGAAGVPQLCRRRQADRHDPRPASQHAGAGGGRFRPPVDMDCACEVGGLADSFRAMVGRLNSNILRMNVLAYTDAITGLPNRAVISHILALAQKQQRKTAPGRWCSSIWTASSA
jgi:hypothetical protein